MIQMPLQRPKKGDTGPQGDTGVQGPPGSPGGLQGDTGSQGTQGDTGVAGGSGAQGDTGVQGAKGDTGADGYIGADGAKGDTGEKGDTGSGDKGDTGDSGSAGPKGDTGSQGVQGDTGIPGTAAAQGDTGEAGQKGDTGTQGDTGVRGDTGAGEQGDTGASGSQGDTGAQGDTGVGVQGDTGTQGLKGDTGEGVGPKGDTGDQGDTGVQGVKGDTGEGSSVSYLDDILDVNAPTPQTNHVLMWNGLEWVAAAEGSNFSFSVASFNDNQSTPQLVGQASTEWRGLGSVSWTASYNNGPPDSAHVAVPGYGNAGMIGPTYTTGLNTAVSYNYPSPDATVTFTLNASKGVVNDNTRTVTVTFYNYVRYGVTSLASGWTSTDVMSLVRSAISNSFTSVPGPNVNAGSGQYLLFAYPSRYADLHDEGFRYYGVTCPFELAATVSVTNNASGTPLTENYKVYRSTNSNLGQSTLSVSTSSQIIDTIYWGLSPVNSGYTQNDIQTLTGGSSAISNVAQRTFGLDAPFGSGLHYVYTLPTRLNPVGDPIEIWINGVDQTGGFTKETISYTNVNGYTENYDVFYSNNTGLGVASVEIK